jgi:hypothetical protein
MNDCVLLAAGEPADDKEDHDSLDELAEQAYLERFRNTSTPAIPKEISVVSPGGVAVL